MGTELNLAIRTARDLGAAIRGRRQELGLNQAQLASQIGVSRQWIIQIEQGRPRATVGLVLKTLAALGFRLTTGAAPSSVSPGEATSSPIDVDAVVSRARARQR